MTLCKTHCISQAPLLHPNPGVSPFCPRALRFSCRNPQNFRNGGGRSYTQLVRHSCAAQSRGRRGWRTNFDSSAGSSSGTVLGSGTRPLPGEQSPRPRSPLPLTPLLVFLSRFGGLRPPLPPFPPSPSSLDADRWSPPPPFSSLVRSPREFLHWCQLNKTVQKLEDCSVKAELIHSDFTPSAKVEYGEWWTGF